MLTPGQLRVMNAIGTHPRSARSIGNVIDTIGNGWTYDRVHAILRRLENRYFVRRTYVKGVFGAVWELTDMGRQAINSDN